MVRCRPAYTEYAFEDLAWLGLAWEQPVLRQSTRFASYRVAFDRLLTMGLLYPCFASRAEIAAAVVPGVVDPDGAPLYPGLRRKLSDAEIGARMSRGEPFALRLRMDRALETVRRRLGETPLTFLEWDGQGEREIILAQPEVWGDAVIVRKEAPASYHLSVVVDDAEQAISHVVRGRDLFAATGLHRLLQVLLDLPEPVYHHHRLIADDVGRKLAKSAGDTSLADLRAAGMTPDEIRTLLGFRATDPLGVS